MKEGTPAQSHRRRKSRALSITPRDIEAAFSRLELTLKVWSGTSGAPSLWYLCLTATLPIPPSRALRNRDQGGSPSSGVRGKFESSGCER